MFKLNLRGIARLGAVAASTTIVLATLGAPARAEEPDYGFPILSTEPTTAVDYKTHSCEGIADGKPASRADGWRLGAPAKADRVVAYLALYSTSLDEDADIFPLYLDKDGLHSITDDDIEDAANLTKARAAAKAAAKVAEEDPDLPIGPAPSGFSGSLTDAGAGGGWIRTSPGLWLVFAAAITEPELTSGTFDLISTCVAADAPSSPAPSNPAPSASPTPGPSLPVTGSNVGLISGIGAGLVALGAVLFVVYRRRRNIKFVA
ncbi:LPXTG cell wall anchor domain-containing protein [Dactylosporangium sucinum]|uniref:LPXTG-motif cell wall anchor domain-containing protein n=1 Tax=Dactylosporangium sucinum TaxID=1424081 RepID=A0A917WKT2_9ACTN|nr:hypothetical protein GCM10007977_009830 [Dactylosporangium sucinum]